MSVKLKEIEDGNSLIGAPPGHIVCGAAVDAVSYGSRMESTCL